MKYFLKNGFIKEEKGFTLAEVLTATIILMILVTIFALGVNALFQNPNIFKREGAFFAAKQEIDKTIAEKTNRDTIYSSHTPYYMVERKVIVEKTICRVTVKVYSDSLKTKLIELSGAYKK